MEQVITYLNKCEKENRLKDKLLENQSLIIENLVDRYAELSDGLIQQVEVLSNKITRRDDLIEEYREYTQSLENDIRKFCFHTELVESNN